MKFVKPKPAYSNQTSNKRLTISATLFNGKQLEYGIWKSLYA